MFILRTVLITFIAIFGAYFLYGYVLDGRFADWSVEFLHNVFGMSYDAAVDSYSHIVRQHESLIILFVVAAIFFFSLFSCVVRFTKYFNEIHQGIDNLANESSEEIVMSPELLPIERKLNTVKNTIEKQKNDILETEQRKNDLIMYLAHDLKTPLASVIGYLNLLKDEGQISGEIRQRYLSVSLEKAERLEDLINEFFEISRFNLSHITLQYGKINLTRLLEQLVYEFKPMLAEKNISCKLEMEADVLVQCDGDKISRVFDNLLRNAVIYSYNASEVIINAVVSDNKVIIKFVNSGDTIPKEKLERIFEQFYRLDSSRGTESGGAGLGLAIAKQIVELHGGTINAASEDEITEFTVTLPRTVGKS
ncbi:MAG: HAMP domain-containing histidine kinase [Clostridium sp.]|nr:HAMP domain-containing histidine kinase [Clostridium sp.]MCM1398697.1 HAMP domain-containing histidine kinase [Clostridium sp.]